MGTPFSCTVDCSLTGVTGRVWTSPVTAYPFRSFPFRQVGSGDGRRLWGPPLSWDELRKDATLTVANGSRFRMRLSRSEGQIQRHKALVVPTVPGERRAATTRPRWASSTGARRGDVSDAEVDYLDYLGSLDGRDTILPSILSIGDHALRAARGSWSSAVGRWGCRRA